MPTLRNSFNTRELLEVAEFTTLIDEGSSYDIDYLHRLSSDTGWDLRVDKDAPVDLCWQVLDQDVEMSDTGTVTCNAYNRSEKIEVILGFTREVPMTPQDFARLLEEQEIAASAAG